MSRAFQLAGGSIILERGDITKQRTEAIANAANSSLLGGGGVDGAIHRAAGPQLLQACREVKAKLAYGMLPTGEAVLTNGFALPARYVIHCVGPIYSQAGSEAPRLLASCYRNALKLCREHGIRSIAFPSISTGVYGYPVEKAAPVALGAVRDTLEPGQPPEEVRFCLFDDATLEAYIAAATNLFA